MAHPEICNKMAQDIGAAKARLDCLTAQVEDVASDVKELLKKSNVAEGQKIAYSTAGGMIGAAFMWVFGNLDKIKRMLI